MVSLRNIPNDQTDDREERISEVLKFFKGVGLENIEEAKLLNRVDSKYWFSAALLQDILTQVAFHYDVLEINETRIQRYKTRYFDTPEDQFYLQHHNGKGNRLKIRKREYQDAGIQFLEIKRKNHKGKTSKIRTSTEIEEKHLNEADRSFLDQHIPVSSEHLEEQIGNQFKRITLVSRERTERCTIDFDIRFFNGWESVELEQLAIIELKQGNRGVSSILRDVLNEFRIKPRGFSKYCIGRAMMQPELKQNRMKESLLRIKQLELS